jgi:hypothetical protein
VAELVPGVYEQLVTSELSQALQALNPKYLQREGLDPADAHVVLARHLAALAQRALQSVGGSDDHARLVRQVELANAVADAIAAAAPHADLAGQLVAESRDVLRAVVERARIPGPIQFPQRPETPLNASALLVNGRDQPRIGSEVQRELASADRVDLLCAFIKWHGLRVLEEPLHELLRRGGRRTPPRGSLLVDRDNAERPQEAVMTWGDSASLSKSFSTLSGVSCDPTPCWSGSSAAFQQSVNH